MEDRNEAEPDDTKVNDSGGKQHKDQQPKSNPPPTATEDKQKKEKKAKQKKSKVARRELLSSPDKIIQTILKETYYETCNLSQLADEKFNAPDYKHIVEEAIQNIQYNDIVSDSTVCMSILPDRGGVPCHPVCLDFTAITSLSCINHVPERKRWRRGGGGGKGGAGGGGGKQQHGDKQHKQDWKNTERWSKHHNNDNKPAGGGGNSTRDHRKKSNASVHPTEAKSKHGRSDSAEDDLRTILNSKIANRKKRAKERVT